jgi:hypothetical protein
VEVGQEDQTMERNDLQLIPVEEGAPSLTLPAIEKVGVLSLTLPTVEGGGRSLTLLPFEEGGGVDRASACRLLRRDPSGGTYLVHRDVGPSRNGPTDLWPSTPLLPPAQMREGEV